MIPGVLDEKLNPALERFVLLARAQKCQDFLNDMRNIENTALECIGEVWGV